MASPHRQAGRTACFAGQVPAASGVRGTWPGCHGGGCCGDQVVAASGAKRRGGGGRARPSAPQHPALAHGRRECPREPGSGECCCARRGVGGRGRAARGVGVMPGSAVRSVALE